CKTVFTQRLKLSRMTWSKPGAHTILDLGVILHSGLWDEVYAAALARLLRPPRENADADLPASPNWPSFRGFRASGVATGQRPPETWDVESGTNIRWKTPIPGLGHSCPVVWENKVFITTAIGQEQTPTLRTGQYGDVDTVENETAHSWRVYCFDKATGQIVWERTAHEGMPAVKRHLKSTHANATPATDGRYLVVSFASEGLYCYDLDGNLIWRKDLGVLDSGWFYDPSYQWEFGSSPVIDRENVIVQCDIQQGSFIAAYELKTGVEKWRTARDEIPSWGTPTVVDTEQGTTIVTNATRFARGYDAATGEELWRLAGNSEITVPTPFAAHGLVFVASGYRPIQPICAVKPDARGEIVKEPGAETGRFLAWRVKQGGPYMPTPIVYDDYLYVCGNGGVLVCYDAVTGQRIYRQRLAAAGGSFVASPVAADGKLYFTGEDGDVRVVKAGAQFELLATNKFGDFCLATPAISEGLFIARTGHHLIAAGKPDEP
ncbi:MAG: PQQ-binding-like beta-propeller repeat protein, partial [Terriglobales bacterium]